MVPRGDPGLRKTRPLNNNNRGNNNNRRRSRGNNNGRPQGGGAQLNRIDSRARGNAPQMLEKYRKLAHDAHLNGDRVTAEYYLQFADHYFRVIADTRVRQEETRSRRDERWGENGDAPPRDDADDGNEFSVEADFPAFDQPPVYTRRDREDRGGERGPDRAGENANERGNDQRRRDERPPRSSAPRDNTPRDNTLRDNTLRDNGVGDNAGFEANYGDGDEGGEARGDGLNPLTPSNNPFVRDNRGPRAARPAREERRPRREGRPDDRMGAERMAPDRMGAERVAGERAPYARRENPAEADIAPASVGLDPSLLPPAISASRRDADVVGDEAPAAVPRRRVRRKPAEDAGQAVETLD